ncbi:hypothetical protein HYC85_019962 [Camellia sinensis]|uniref:NB-ARC domain-containing protein n=1 Tax=Camellia sinensis TaxID=4442 RepID=A0A7J7GNR0_CAMSI|nr:hypothetical protein HYC85_019962 [Camellia sinensis]
MRNSEDQWVDGLNNFRNRPDMKHKGMWELYKLLSFCYNNLNSEQKNCFRYGALYSEDSDIPIDCLLECWAGECFLGSDDADEYHINGHSILEHLKNISLIDNELETLPDRPDCSVLSTLFLRKNLSLKTIPALFFEYIETLTVLDQCYTGILSLPQPISKLINLKVFYLKDCIYLTELPSQLEGLQHLKVLDFRGSGYHLLNNFSRVASSCKVISKLFALKELIIDVKAPHN